MQRYDTNCEYESSAKNVTPVFDKLYLFFCTDNWWILITQSVYHLRTSRAHSTKICYPLYKSLHFAFFKKSQEGALSRSILFRTSRKIRTRAAINRTHSRRDGFVSARWIADRRWQRDDDSLVIALDAKCYRHDDDDDEDSATHPSVPEALLR